MPSILSRFLPRPLLPLLVDLATLPSGYTQSISGYSAPSPVYPRIPPGVTTLPDLRIAPATIASREDAAQPTPAAEGAIGRFRIGVSGIGTRDRFHGLIDLDPASSAIGDFAIGVSPIEGS